MKILVLNSGSSSLKYQLIDTSDDLVMSRGYYERIGQDNSFVTHRLGEVKYKFEIPVKDHKEALKVVLDKLTDDECGAVSTLNDIDAVGHRVVHGGDKFKQATLITDEVINQIEECIPLAPLHNPAALAIIKACKALLPDVPSIAAFDTAFHQTIPEERYIYPIPYKYYEEDKIRKYGFHGISHEYVANRVAELKKEPIENLKIVNCHLGQGASICAIQNGKSVDTSMGFTPLAGIPMCTRTGDLDPSIVTYIMKKENINVEDMDKILNNESGLYGISQVSKDFRDMENAAFSGENHNAMLAMKIFYYKVAQTVASYAVSMQGIDVITFTAGIGEKGAEVRQYICDYLKCFGVELDKELNDCKGEERKISSQDSKIEVWVVPTNEELMIAKEAERIVVEK